MATLAPRAVLVTRPTDLDEFLVQHGTMGQAEFFLSSRGQSIQPLIAIDKAQKTAHAQVKESLPADWRRIEVSRQHLDRFLFSEGDVVIAVGQDGLVANLAKYACGYPVIGVNPLPDRYPGKLVKHAPDRLAAGLKAIIAGDFATERRAMVKARTSQGQDLLALNEVFVGHISHQSARYTLTDGDIHERHSSSGLIVASGTGTTGWARSIIEATHADIAIGPTDRQLAYFAREPWPSAATGTQLRQGYLRHDARLAVRSEMNQGGVIFADGIETDRIDFAWGTDVEIGLAHETLDLVADF